MIPHERSLVKQFGPQGFSLVGVNGDPDREAVVEFVRKNEMSWPSFWQEGANGPISKRFNQRSWPTLYLLDRHGVIRYRNVRGEALDKAIQELLSGSAHEN